MAMNNLEAKLNNFLWNLRMRP